MRLNFLIREDGKIPKAISFWYHIWNGVAVIGWVLMMILLYSLFQQLQKLV